MTRKDAMLEAFATSELDKLRNMVIDLAAERDAAHARGYAAGLEAGAAAQMERDCIAVCWGCRKGREYHGDTHIWNDGAWAHQHPIEQRMRCRAANIRAEYASRARPPASADAATEGE